MKPRFRFTRAQIAATVALAAIVASVAAVVSSTPMAAAKSTGTVNVRSEHWGVIARNTIGSPVADHRNGPYGSFGFSGPLARPPYGQGSLGIAVATNSTNRIPPSEKAYFGNEVDYFGFPVLSLNEVGFHVFQTNENISYGGPRNLPNINFEIDANFTACGDDYTSMVWVPDPSPNPNRWSGYMDATTTGGWYFTGAEGVCSVLCSEATPCPFSVAMTRLNDGPPAPVMYTAAINKGRDNLWAGAVDGFRINSKIYDFELFGVFERRVGGGHDDDDDDDDDDD